MSNYSYTQASLLSTGSLESYFHSIIYQITGLCYKIQEAYGTCAFQEASMKYYSFQISCLASIHQKLQNIKGG